MDEIENNRKMAEIMGYKDGGMVYGQKTYCYKGSFKVTHKQWKPHSDISQALMVADRLCDLREIRRSSDYIPDTEDSEPYYFEIGAYETRGATEVEAVYKALCAAIDILTP